MSFPEFYGLVPPLVLHDPLAQVLGAASDGVMKYRYADAVRLAGHSCPTVAGAWLMTRHALQGLYPEGRPVRGGIKVALKGDQSHGTVGVVGSVMGLITGAAGEGGFQGLAGKHSRRNLLVFGAEMEGDAQFTRLDTGVRVEMKYQPNAVPPDPAMPPLMARVTSGEASAEERETFCRLWQDRVRRILLEHAEDPELVRLTVLKN